MNPAPYINSDGSVFMLWRSINYTKGSGQSYYAIATAPAWSGPFTWNTENIFPSFSCAGLYKKARLSLVLHLIHPHES